MLRVFVLVSIVFKDRYTLLERKLSPKIMFKRNFEKKLLLEHL